MHPGAPLEAIQNAEKALSVRFPAIYRAFLSCWNGGSLFDQTVGIWHVPTEELGYPANLIKENLEPLGWPDKPASFLIIARYSYPVDICLVLDSTESPTAIRRNHEIGKIDKQWPTLVDWLTYEMEFGRELIDYDGSWKRNLAEKLVAKVAGLFKRRSNP
jgi:hypothetical protein